MLIEIESEKYLEALSEAYRKGFQDGLKYQNNTTTYPNKPIVTWGTSAKPWYYDHKIEITC